MGSVDLKKNQKGNLLYRWRERHESVDIKGMGRKFKRNFRLTRPCRRDKTGRTVEKCAVIFSWSEGIPEDTD